MSVHKKVKRVTTNVLQEMKNNGEKIAMLTAYDFSMAKIVDDAGIDVILVGDSASNVMAGHETTLPITLDQMIYHASAVVRAINRALVVVDLPFGSYQGNSKEALTSAIRIMKESGAHAVKMEGGSEIEESVRRILSAGIPVMGHLGLTPQSIYKFGTYVVRAREDEEAERLIADAKVLEEEIGCFVEEGTPREFRATSDFDEFQVEEFLEHAIGRNPSHGIDGCLCHGLAIGNHGESFHRRCGKALGLAAGEKVFHKASVIGRGIELPALGAFQDEEGTARLLVVLIESCDAVANVFVGDFGKSPQLGWYLYDFGIVWSVVFGNVFRLFGILAVGSEGLILQLGDARANEPGDFGERQWVVRGHEKGLDDGGKSGRGEHCWKSSRMWGFDKQVQACPSLE
jgi:3-methyl-2-oxobutanoate hydroxymethyltransferase